MVKMRLFRKVVGDLQLRRSNWVTLNHLDFLQMKKNHFFKWKKSPLALRTICPGKWGCNISGMTPFASSKSHPVNNTACLDRLALPHIPESRHRCHGQIIHKLLVFGKPFLSTNTCFFCKMIPKNVFGPHFPRSWFWERVPKFPVFLIEMPISPSVKFKRLINFIFLLNVIIKSWKVGHRLHFSLAKFFMIWHSLKLTCSPLKNDDWKINFPRE